MKICKHYCHFLLGGIFLSCQLVEPYLCIHGFAQEAPQPYIYAEELPQAALSRDQCLKALTERTIEMESNTQETLARLEEELNQAYQAFELLNQEIADLESGEDQSLQQGQEGLKEMINEVYAQYQTEYEGFNDLTEDQQMDLILQEEGILEWQTYLEDIELAIQTKVSQRDQVEKSIEKYQYDLEHLYDSEETTSRDTSHVYDACKVLPYSVDMIPPQDIFFESQTIEDIIVETNHYMQELIPKAYQSVSYRQILDEFIDKLNHPDDLITGKNPIRLDPDTLTTYTFAKTLSQHELQSFSQQALLQYFEDQSVGNYLQNFHHMIDAKHQQFQYFYAINHDSFEKLKQSLCQIMNDHQWVSDTDIAHIKALHESYQVKLIIFDPQQKQWQPVEEGSNGYEEEYQDYDFESILSQVRDDNPKPTKLSDTSPNKKSAVSDKDSHSKGKDLADKLMTRRDASRVKNLEPPKGHKVSPHSSKTKSNPHDKDKSKKEGAMKLPTTGEKRRWTYLAIGLLVIGLGLFLYNLYQERQEKSDRLKKMHKD